MNIVISHQLLRKLIETVCAYEAELNETQKCLHAQEEIDSMEKTIIDLQALGALCRRIENHQKKNPYPISPGTLAQLRRRK
jgi:hypothetical protein